MADEPSITESLSAMVDEYKTGELSALFASAPDTKTDDSTGDDTLSASLSAVFTRTGGTTDTKLVSAESTARKQRKRKATSDASTGSSTKVEHGEKAKGKKAIAEQKERDARTLFVGNVSLAKGMKPVRPALFKHFSQHGLKVHSVRVRSVPIKGTPVAAKSSYKLMRKASIVQGEVDVTSTCNAYVTFTTLEDASTALKQAQDDDKYTKFWGLHLRLDRIGDSASDMFDRRTTVFVGNLLFTTSDEVLRAFFEAGLKDLGVKDDEGGDGAVAEVSVDGGVKDGEEGSSLELVSGVRIVRDRATNVGKGFAYVSFRSMAVMEKALLLNDNELTERKVRVTRCKRSASTARPGQEDAGAATGGGGKKMKGAAGTHSAKPFEGQRASKQAAKLRMRNKKPDFKQNRKGGKGAQQGKKLNVTGAGKGYKGNNPKKKPRHVARVPKPAAASTAASMK